MAPPTYDVALERARPSRTDRPFGVRPSDVVILMDVVAMGGLFWAAKVIFNLDNSMAVFALCAFALVVSPAHVRERLSCSALDDTWQIVRAVSVAYVIASAASALGGEKMSDMRVLVAVAAAAVPALLGARAAAYATVRGLRRRAVAERALVVGGGFIARRVVKTLAEHDEYGLDVVGAVDDDPYLSSAELGTHVIGSARDLPDLIAARDVRVVIVAFSSSADQAGLVDVIRDARAAGAAVWVVPRFFELGASSITADHLWGLPVVRLKAPAHARPQWVAKRAFDIVVAAVGLIVTAPVIALASLAVFIESGTPVLLRQVRVGRDGARFRMYKLRSMVETDSDQPDWCDEAEARVTRVGRVIRALAIDEMPQLINVLKGEMSIVGPRPDQPYFVNEFSALYPPYATRHRLPMGLTGWSQVNGLRGDTSIEERAIFDNYYIENWSMAQDIKIVLRTLKAMLTRA